MRVAIHHPARTEPDGTAVPESVSAYKLGRIDDTHGVNHLTGEVASAREVAEALMAQAKAEFADCYIAIERLVDNGDGTSKWVPEADAKDESLLKDGATHPVTVSAEQGQEAQ